MNSREKDFHDNTIVRLDGIEHYKCNSCDMQISGEKQVYSHLAGSKHEKSKKLLTSQVASLSMNDGVRAIIEATIDKHIITPQQHLGPSYYVCNVCNKIPISGEDQVMQHLDGQKHKKNIQRSNNNTFDAKMVTSATQATHVTLAATQATQVTSVTQTTQVTSATQAMTVNCCSGTSNKPDYTTNYQVKSSPLGIVVVFNYIFQGHPIYRQGAENDSINVQKVFEALNYKVLIHEDKTKEQTEKIIKDLAQGNIFQKVDSFICFILSHGGENTKINTYYKPFQDEEKMDIDDFRLPFNDSHCRSLKNKPKIFFTNFCRGEDEENIVSLVREGFQSDGIKEAPSDMITFYASINRFQAIRNILQGTIFVSSICKILQESSDLELTTDFKMKLKAEMKKNKGTTVEMQDYGFKRFYFRPQRN